MASKKIEVNPNFVLALLYLGMALLARWLDAGRNELQPALMIASCVGLALYYTGLYIKDGFWPEQPPTERAQVLEIGPDAMLVVTVFGEVPHPQAGRVTEEIKRSFGRVVAPEQIAVVFGDVEFTVLDKKNV